MKITIGAGDAVIFLRVIIPASIPFILVGVRIGLGSAWATVVAAELIAAQSGLGFRMQQAQLYYDLPTIFGTTPVIADVRGAGTLEMIGLGWQIQADSAVSADSATVSWRNLRWQLVRLDLSAAAPDYLSWAAYMGTATDGRFRPPRGAGSR